MGVAAIGTTYREKRVFYGPPGRDAVHELRYADFDLDRLAESNRFYVRTDDSDFCIGGQTWWRIVNCDHRCCEKVPSL